MNEGIAPFLNIDIKNRNENELLIQKIDGLLLQYGLQYSGIMNMYIPNESKNRDNMIYDAIDALHQCKWLDGILASVCICNMTHTCELSDIITHNMNQPKREKFEYYEKYFRKTKQLPHTILVDDEKMIQDGYITYLLAQKYNVKAEVMNVVSGSPICKVVIGHHVTKNHHGFILKNDKRYVWRYTLHAPVVPGDILEVNTEIGNAYICVDKIDYVTGEKFCSKHKKVIKHMHKHIEEEG